MPDKQEKEKNSPVENIVITVGNQEIIDRFGSASAEYIKGYTSIDQQTGKESRLGLKKISEWKKNEGTIDENKIAKQQAGYSAEVAKVSRDNANNIINKDNKRTIRTDDHHDFGINHPVYDHIELRDGVIIQGSGSQMKFVGNPRQLIDKIATGEGGGKNDLSRYLGVKLNLPSDQIDEELKEYCNQQALKLREQADRIEKKGDIGLAEKKRNQALNYEKVRDNLCDSGMTTEDALFYRNHPGLATIKDIAVTSHRAGIEGAKTGILVGASMSTVRNISALTRDEIEIEDALYNISKDTAKAAATGYITSAAGSAIKGGMEQASPDAMRDVYLAGRKYIVKGQVSATEMTKINIISQETAQKCRDLSKTALPGLIVTTSIELAPLIKKYYTGEINGEEFFAMIGERGAAMLAGSWGATWGAIAGGIILPGVGAIIGGMVGSLVCATISSMLYAGALSDLREAKIAQQHLEIAKENYKRTHALFVKYREELEQQFNTYFSYLEGEISISIDSIENSIALDNIADFEKSSNRLASVLNTDLRFSSFDSFKTHMNTKTN